MTRTQAADVMPALPALAPDEDVPLPVLRIALRVLSAANADLERRLAVGALLPVAQRIAPMRRSMDDLAFWTAQAKARRQTAAIDLCRRVDLLSRTYLHTLERMNEEVRQLRERVAKASAEFPPTPFDPKPMPKWTVEEVRDFPKSLNFTDAERREIAKHFAADAEDWD